jgi:excisionase family DNA binding protein
MFLESGQGDGGRWWVEKMENKMNENEKENEERKIQKQKREKTRRDGWSNTDVNWVGYGAASEVYAYGLSSNLTAGSRSRKIGDSAKLFENLTWLTSNEAAHYLRLPSVGALRVLVCKRRVPFHKLGRSLRFKKVELDRLLESSRTGGI